MEIEVNEEMRINSTIGKVRAIDEDLGENAEIDYAIVDGNDNKIFEVMKLNSKILSYLSRKLKDIKRIMILWQYDCAFRSKKVQIM